MTRFGDFEEFESTGMPSSESFECKPSGMQGGVWGKEEVDLKVSHRSFDVPDTLAKLA